MQMEVFGKMGSTKAKWTTICGLGLAMTFFSSSTLAWTTLKFAPSATKVESKPGFSSVQVGSLKSKRQPTTKPVQVLDRPQWRPKQASQVLALVQVFYSSAQDLQADFNQTYYNPTYAALTPSQGTVKLKKPGKMLWDYDGQTRDVYSNGSSMWMVEHDTRQVVSTAVSEDQDLNVAMKFLFGGQEILRDFLVRYANDVRIKKYGDSEHYVLQLKPRKKNSNFKGLLLVVHAATGRVDRFLVASHDGSTNYFELSRVKTNLGLSDELFKKRIPSGYAETRG